MLSYFENYNFKDIYNKKIEELKLFYKKYKNEIIIVLSLMIFYLIACPCQNQYENNRNYTSLKYNGGALPAPAPVQKPIQQQYQPNTLYKSTVYAFGRAFLNNPFVSKILNILKQVFSNIFGFAVLLLVIILLPSIPLLLFMLFTFLMLRNNMASLKSY
jgi:hypothetical protein